MSYKNLSSAECTAESRARTARQALSELGDSQRWLWVRFESGKSQNVVEVAMEDGQFIMNIPHSEKGGLLPKLKSLDFEIPPWWKVKKDKTKGLLTSGFLEIEAAGSDQDKIVAFVAALGREFFGWKDDEILSACLQK